MSDMCWRDSLPGPCRGTDSAGRILSSGESTAGTARAARCPPPVASGWRCAGRGRRRPPLPGPARISDLHGVTGAMAVEILAAHIPATDGAAALAHVHAEHAALYAATEPVTQPHPASPRGSELAVAAVRSLDPHQVSSSRPASAGTRQPAIPLSPPPRKRHRPVRLTGNRRPA